MPGLSFFAFPIKLITFMSVIRVPHVGSNKVMLLSVHVGANPLYGYYAAVPVYKVAVRHIRSDYRKSLANLTHTAIYLPGHDLCPDGGDHTAEFFADYYFRNRDVLTAPGSYLVLAEPDCTNQALVMAEFARELDLPLFISVAGDSSLANRQRYPTTSAVTPMSGNDVLTSVEGVLKRFSWRTLSLICDSMTQSPGLANFFYARCIDIRKFFVRKGYTWIGVEFNSAYQRDFRSYLAGSKDQSRIYVLLTIPPLVRQLMIEARRLGMTSGDFVFISIQPTKRPGIAELTWRGNGTHEDDEFAVEAYKCLMVITGDVPVWSDIRNLTSEFVRVAQTSYNYTYEDEENDMQVSIYESTMMFAQVFDESYPSVMDMPKKEFISKFNNRAFNFAARNFSTDSKGGKVGPVVVQRFSIETEKMEMAMLFNTVTLNFYNIQPELWYWVGRNSSPPDVPLCGFRNDMCYHKNNSEIILGIMGTCLVMVCLAGGIVLHCMLERRKQLMKLWWLIERTTMLAEIAEEKLNKPSILQTYPGRKGRFHTQPVYALPIQTPEQYTVYTFHKQKKILTLLFQLRYLDHSSLAKFKGIYIGPMHLNLISDLGERGTLRALLDEPNQVALDSTVRYSLCWDILEAIEYLHKTPLTCHGNLTSLNCVVDARFRAKVVECGFKKLLNQLNLSRSPDSGDQYSYPVDFIWKPLEVLQVRLDAKLAFNLANTQDCDIYALGMIFYEIVSGNTPLDVDLDSPTSVLATVELLDYQGGFHVPPSEEEHFPPGLKEILDSCLGPVDFRPSVRRVRTEFHRVRRRNTDVVGHILRRIEAHASDLESVVAERTQALETEMAIADSLLQEMLPLQIVRLLRDKKHVPSELFESVSLMFSDMPAFANITATCDPLQIIDFLNTTYTLIDGVLPEFDVYKVETINDCYVVVSGLPHINGSQHVFEICRLALTLRKVTKQIEDPTDETRRVLLRIGIHTGACVAGVIGVRMPRYCLFGDTMNTASRMQSHSQAGKIHISLDTKDRIARSPNFETEPRGQVEIKGKGLMETFWLTERII